MNIVFLDLDGVVNGHDFDVKAQSTRIQYRCIKQLNRIIKATDCKFVLSSAWRYMILKRPRCRPAMTLMGFEYLMRTHGTVGFRMIGTTCSDEEVGWEPGTNKPVRGFQIRKWVGEHAADVGNYVAIDDDDDISACGVPFVQTNPKWGLSRRNADEAIRLLRS